MAGSGGKGGEGLSLYFSRLNDSSCSNTLGVRSTLNKEYFQDVSCKFDQFAGRYYQIAHLYKLHDISGLRVSQMCCPLKTKANDPPGCCQDQHDAVTKGNV